ncbi:hypothetical protein C2S51_000250 [Perilla frutescens var. frutescens]|nr:hypothetical protein C2S51_000250 [Perilla frutescens var. frutescens]
MTRSSQKEELVFDPEPEKTLHQLRRVVRESKEASSSGLGTFDLHQLFDETMAGNVNQALVNADEPEPLIREIGCLRNNWSICIVLPLIANNSEIRPRFIQVLPKFSDLPGESAHKHLAEFDLVCFTLHPQGFSTDNLRLLTFSHTLQGRARDWLFDLPSGSITTWNELEGQFLRKFFLESRAANLRMTISSIKQKQSESLADYWERFQQMCRKCPDHGFSDYQLLTNYFYRGMSTFDRKIVDIVSGGSLINKTLAEAKQLIIDMVSGGQQYENEDDDRYRPVKGAERADSSSVNEKIDALTSLVRGLAAAHTPTGRYGVCLENGHSTDACPTLQDSPPEQAYYGSDDAQQDALRRKRYDPYSNTYNPGWRDHPNFGWRQSDQKVPGVLPQRPPPSGQYGHTDKSAPSMSEIMKCLEQSSALVNKLAQSQKAFQQETQAALGNMDAQITQLATQINKLQGNQGKLPSQAEQNPKGNISDVALRSGKDAEEEQPVTESAHTEVKADTKVPNSLVAAHFPSRLVRNKKEDDEKEILELFKKFEINLSLIDSIKQVLRFLRFPQQPFLFSVHSPPATSTMGKTNTTKKTTVVVPPTPVPPSPVKAQTLLPPSEIAPSPSQTAPSEATVAPFLCRTRCMTTAGASSPSGVPKRRRVVSPSPTATVTAPPSPPSRAATPPSPLMISILRRSRRHSKRLETSPPTMSTCRRTKPPQYVDVATRTTSSLPPLQNTPAITTTPLPAPVTVQPPERSPSPLLADTATESSAIPSPPSALLSRCTHSHTTQAGPTQPPLQSAEATPSFSRRTYIQRPPFRPQDRELSLEFLSSYVFDAARELDDAHVVLFTLDGRNFNFSVNALNVLLGFKSEESLHDEVYESTYCEVPASFSSHTNERWSALSIDSEFVPRPSRSAHLRDDAVRLCHQFLAYTLFGRIDGLNVVTVHELFILDNMFLGEKLKFGSWLCRKWQYSANHFLCKAPLGHLITLLAQRLHVPLAEPEFLSATLFIVVDFAAMKLLCVNVQGQYQLSRPGVQGPSPLFRAGTTSSAVLPFSDIEALFECFTQRLDTRLDSIDERLTALEQVVRHLSSSS